jgi:hypothetical protein
MADTIAEGIRLLNRSWCITLHEFADVVVAGVSGEAATFNDLSAALSCASRVVSPQGTIVVLSQGAPQLGLAAQLIRDSQSSDEALSKLRRHAFTDVPAAFQWASATNRAKVYLLSDLSQEVVEELFAIPLDSANQVQRLIAAAGRCAFIADADKTLALVRKQS